MALVVTAVLVLSVMFLLADPAAQANHVQPDELVPQSPAANNASFWETYLADKRGIDNASCDKIDEAEDSAFIMPGAPNGETWVLLVVKQATTNYVYYDPIGGHSYPSTGSQAPGYSHLIVCSVPETTTTTVPETTSTVPETTSTTAEVSPTSITSPPTTAEVLPTSITSAPPTTAVVDPVDTLPFTGVESGTPALLALALIGIGALALVATRRAEED